MLKIADATIVDTTNALPSGADELMEGNVLPLDEASKDRLASILTRYDALLVEIDELSDRLDKLLQIEAPAPVNPPVVAPLAGAATTVVNV